jgi:hypothetical protein
LCFLSCMQLKDVLWHIVRERLRQARSRPMLRVGQLQRSELPVRASKARASLPSCHSWIHLQHTSVIWTPWVPDSSSQGTGLCEKKAPCGLHFWFGGRWLTESNLPDECAKRAMRPVEYALGCPQGSQPGVRDRAKKKPPPKIASPAPLDAMLFYEARGLPRHDAIAIFVCNATFAQQLCIRGGGNGGLLFRTTRSQHFSWGWAEWLS